ncbi:MAG: hypothetical protein A3F91_02020 [Flavobacteria bacterium RIFCSPLOWO2_12_FULL_35_11]|nr:MAG: hypothetical protein A3F91_02020 [Flavobacteria bacterium RIFCSPLOWO2_12_FULL_35_11]
MLRITPSIYGEKVVQASTFTIEPGGSESNVAIALSLMGNRCGFITRLPGDVLSEKIIRYLKSYSLDISHITIGGRRVGLYWAEIGTGPRASQVFYDRAGSSFSEISYSDFDWNKIFTDTDWFHTSGISPAVSENVYITLKKIFTDISQNLRISIDLNYRSKLWEWAKKKQLSVHKIMWEMCSNACLIIGNETDFNDALGIQYGDIRTQDNYEEVASQCFKNLPHLEYVAISLRESVSAGENVWSGLLFAKESNSIVAYKGLKIRITNIIDRIGTGDSFAAGIIHGIINYKEDYQRTINFAVGLSALNHTVRGDASQFGISDVEDFLKSPEVRIIR